MWGGIGWVMLKRGILSQFLHHLFGKLGHCCQKLPLPRGWRGHWNKEWTLVKQRTTHTNKAHTCTYTCFHVWLPLAHTQIYMPLPLFERVLKFITYFQIRNCWCNCEYVCVYLPCCIYQVVVYRAMSYTRVVLSPYLYLSSFSFSWCTFFAIITTSFSPFQVSILLWGKLYSFVSFKQIPFCNFFLCLLKYLTSSFLLNIRSFLSVSSKLFINLYIIIEYPFSLLTFSVVGWVSFNLSSYIRFSKSGKCVCQE